MSFPTNLNTFTTHANGDIINPDFDNEQQVAISALEAKVGVDSSAVTTSHDYKLSEVTSTDKAVGKTATQTLTNKTLTTPVVTSPKITLGSDAVGDLHYTSNVDGTQSRLAVGADNYILKINGSTIGWEAETATVNGSTTVAGGFEASTETELVAGTATGGTGAVLVVTPDIIYKRIKFGGDGSDGALTVSSGNTNIDLANAAFVVKNYTSISITGTGSVTFINPATTGSTIYLKSQGVVTLTSSAAPMIDASGCGTAGGAAGTNAGASTAGTDINQTFAIYSAVTNSGGRPTAGSFAPASTAITNPTYYGATLRATTLGNERLPVLLIPGAGGSGGSSNNNPSSPGVAGAGGNGGGGLYIECAGAWNFTTTNGISVAGKNGSNGSGTTNASGGGGGGAPGMFLALYTTLTANSGTVNVSAGSGGSPLAGVGTAYGGGGGSSAGNAGSAGSSGTGGAGGAAITNASLVLKNNSIA